MMGNRDVVAIIYLTGESMKHIGTNVIDVIVDLWCHNDVTVPMVPIDTDNYAIHLRTSCINTANTAHIIDTHIIDTHITYLIDAE